MSIGIKGLWCEHRYSNNPIGFSQLRHIIREQSDQKRALTGAVQGESVDLM